MRLKTVMHLKFLLIVLLPSLQGCGLYVDNRGKIMQATLYETDGRFNEKAFNSLLLARFPIGSESSALKSFVASLNGQCSETSDSLNCAITVAGTLCAYSGIDIASKISPPGFISSLIAKERGGYC